jgi:hypothetical protein
MHKTTARIGYHYTQKSIMRTEACRRYKHRPLRDIVLAHGLDFMHILHEVHSNGIVYILQFLYTQKRDGTWLCYKPQSRPNMPPSR